MRRRFSSRVTTKLTENQENSKNNLKKENSDEREKSNSDLKTKTPDHKSSDYFLCGQRPLTSESQINSLYFNKVPTLCRIFKRAQHMGKSPN